MLGGAIAVMDVLLLKVTLDEVAVPNATVAPFWNPEPVRVTEVPPEEGPELGVMDVRLGATEYVNALARLAVWPSGLVSATETVPAA